jgi:uncharacterized protein
MGVRRGRSDFRRSGCASAAGPEPPSDTLCPENAARSPDQSRSQPRRLCGDCPNPEELLAGRAPQVTGAHVGHAAFSSIVCEGGYPEARLRPSGRPRTRWFSNYIDTTLERDLHELAEARRVQDIGHLLRLLATQSANLLNYRTVAQRLGMDPKTAKAYVALLEQMFLIQRLPAWRPGLGAREATTPKVYVCDPGLLAYLLGADESRVEVDDQVTGKICETFVAAEIMKHASWANDQIRVHHYQRDREDVDLVLENRRGEIAAIEIKARATVSENNWRWATDSGPSPTRGSGRDLTCATAAIAEIRV